MATIIKNKKVFREYSIEEKIEVGIVLVGTEVKSLRLKNANLADCHAKIEAGELWLYNLHISPYEQGNRFNHQPFRKRKLLIKKYELRKMIGKIKEKGYSLIPIELYFNSRGLVKVLLGLGKGKKLYDKRQDLAKKEANRDMERKFRNYNK